MNNHSTHLFSKKQLGAVLVCIATVSFLLVASGARGQALTPTIKFLSPSSFDGEVPTVTDADGGVDTAFRLSAWTANAVPGALVEFELIPGDRLSPPLTIGTGQAVTGDTYEYMWDVAEGPGGVLEGRHTLKAVLYDSNGVEIASDSLAVDLAHGVGTPADDGDPSIDLIYPRSGGPLGQYTPPGKATNSVLDGSHNADATVTAYFTTSLPGTAPEWVACSPQESTTNFPDGVRCTYPMDDPASQINEGVDASKVTAVALFLIGDSSTSADVARVLPYVQIPTRLSANMYKQGRNGAIDAATPGTRSVTKDATTGSFPCSDWVRASLTDQVGRKVAGANIDAHASGPSDQLKFHTGHLSPPLGSPHSREPNEGHGFPEDGTNCIVAADAVAKQGEHGIAAKPDLKHIESTGGTRDSGFFDLRLRTDQPGVTQLTVWADKKDDDTFCSDEADSSFSTSLGWGTEDPQTEAQQPADCATVPGPDPTISPDPEPDFDGSRTVRIETSSNRVRAGRAVDVVGVVTAVEDMCEVSQTLKLQSKWPSATRFRTIATGATDLFGVHGFRVTVKKTKVYRVVAPVAGECVRARSGQKKIRAF